MVVPSTATINRILRRKRLVVPRPRKKPKSAYVRFERPGPMQLWGIDIVGGVRLVDVRTGVVREVKLVTGVDDHSRYCVMAQVVERATGRAVCLAFAQALADALPDLPVAEEEDLRTLRQRDDFLARVIAYAEMLT